MTSSAALALAMTFWFVAVVTLVVGLMARNRGLRGEYVACVVLSAVLLTVVGLVLP